MKVSVRRFDLHTLTYERPRTNLRPVESEVSIDHRADWKLEHRWNESAARRRLPFLSKDNCTLPGTNPRRTTDSAIPVCRRLESVLQSPLLQIKLLIHELIEVRSNRCVLEFLREASNPRIGSLNIER